MSRVVRKLLGELEQLDRFGAELEQLERRRLQRKRDAELGVLPTHEVRPGVFEVVPRGRRALQDVRELLEDFATFGKGARR